MVRSAMKTAPLALALMLPALAACGGSGSSSTASGSGAQPRMVANDEYRDWTATGQVRGQGQGPTSGIVLFGVDRERQAREAAQQGSGVSVNAYLWRAALDTLGFMPLASADPFGGTIITDWYQPASADGERFRAQAYIMGRQLRSDGVRVQVFRQVNQRGNWVDAPVSTATNSELEDKVLARARELRSQSASR